MNAEQFQARTGATPEQMVDLDAFRLMLIETNAVMNLVGPDTLPDFWNRHAVDSWQLLAHAPNAKVWADIGAGAGFPGVVLAIFLKRTPGAKIWLIDSLAKRCRFLDQAKAALALDNAVVVNGRAEDQTVSCDVVTARAVAPLDRLLGYAQPFFRAGAQGLFLKGEKVEAELSEARRSWQFQADVSPSISDPRGRSLSVRSPRRVRA